MYRKSNCFKQNKMYCQCHKYFLSIINFYWVLKIHGTIIVQEGYFANICIIGGHRTESCSLMDLIRTVFGHFSILTAMQESYDYFRQLLVKV